jgi:hypothetical protein
MFFVYDVMFPYVNTWEGDVFMWDHVKTFGNTSPWASEHHAMHVKMAQCHPCHITILPHQNHIRMMSSITNAIDMVKRSLMMVHVMFCQLMGGCTHTPTLVHLELP